MRLIVGAFPPETSELEALTGTDFKVFSVGIGPVDSLIGLEALIVEFGPEEVIFLGSAGIYEGRDSSPERSAGSEEATGVEQYAGSACFTFLDPGSLSGASRMVPAMRQFSIPRMGPLGSHLMGSGLFRSAIINTTMALSLKAHPLKAAYLEEHLPGLSQAVEGREGWRDWPVLENLEAFSLARFCEIHKIGFSAFVAVTNRVGPSGSEQWAANYRSMGQALQQKLIGSIENWKP